LGRGDKPSGPHFRASYYGRGLADRDLAALLAPITYITPTLLVVWEGNRRGRGSRLHLRTCVMSVMGVMRPGAV
jgi:hypothetical protein